jgi:hypothetical protein
LEPRLQVSHQLLGVKLQIPHKLPGV